MRLKLLCFFALFALMLNTRAQQSISGKITNNKSKPVSGASIYLLNSNRGTTSDAQGNYQFKNLLPGKYEVIVSSVGYATVSSQIDLAGNKAGVLNFELKDLLVQLDAVYVSAEKKEEALQKVPLSVTAISSRQVNDYRLWNSKELTAIVPNFYSANSGDERNVVSIRGIATTSYDPAVTTYIDGVNQFSLDTYIAQLSDIERVEILRGPQGTLYGRNAMGGVINIITKKPGNKLDGFAELSGGNYQQWRLNAGIRIPVIKDKIFMGMSGAYHSRNGFYTNDFDNSSFDKQHTASGNFYLRIVPRSQLAITLNAKYQEARNNGAFPLVNGVDESFSNPFHLNQDAAATMTDKISNSSLQVNYTGRKFDFNSQTSYQYNHRNYNKPLDGDFSPIDGVTIINNYGNGWNKVKVITQEFKFNSPESGNSKLKWTAGSYLFYNDNPNKQATHFGRDAVYVGAPDTNFATINTTKARSYGLALFGQLSLPVTRKLKIIAGMRYDYEKKKYNVLGEYQKDPGPTPQFETRPDTSASAGFNAFSPKLGLACSINQHSNAFLTYSRGYRTGGLTALSPDPSQPPLFPYKPEYSSNFELGIKNTLLQNRLQVNFTVFLTYVTDAQVPTLVLPDAVTVTKNAGKLHSKGVELEISAKPVKGLQADYNFGYTNARYQNLKLSQNGSAVNLDGRNQVFTPESTSMLALQYVYAFGSNSKIRITARGEWQYLGQQYFDLANNIKQGDYSLLNVKAGIGFGQTSLMFWGRNIADKKYISYAYDFGAIHLGDPATFGITLSTAF